MGGDSVFQRCDERAATSAVEVGGEAFLDGLGAQRLERRARPLCERLVDEVGERGTAPQLERRPQRRRAARRCLRPRGAEQPGEAVRVDGVWVDGQPVRRADRLKDRRRRAPGPARLERCTQPRDVAMDDGRRRRRRMLAPKLVDQPLGGHRVAGVQHEDREQRPGAAGRKLDAPTAVDDGCRAEDPEVHHAPTGQPAYAPWARGLSGSLAAGTSMTSRRHIGSGKERGRPWQRSFTSAR